MSLVILIAISVSGSLVRAQLTTGTFSEFLKRVPTSKKYSLFFFRAAAFRRNKDIFALEHRFANTCLESALPSCKTIDAQMRVCNLWLWTDLSRKAKDYEYLPAEESEYRSLTAVVFATANDANELAEVITRRSNDVTLVEHRDNIYQLSADNGPRYLSINDRVILSANDKNLLLSYLSSNGEGLTADRSLSESRAWKQASKSQTSWCVSSSGETPMGHTTEPFSIILTEQGMHIAAWGKLNEIEAYWEKGVKHSIRKLRDQTRLFLRATNKDSAEALLFYLLAYTQGADTL